MTVIVLALVTGFVANMLWNKVFMLFGQLPFFFWEQSVVYSYNGNSALEQVHILLL